MAAFTENFDHDSFRELYDIRAVNSLAEFLLPGQSLCIIHNPKWREFKERENVEAARVGGTGGRVRLITVQGHNRQGLPDEVLLGICGPDDQGYYRQKLDQIRDPKIRRSFAARLGHLYRKHPRPKKSVSAEA